MPELWYEDFVVGDVKDFQAPRAITKDEILRYAETYDPQPFHLDEKAGAQSMLGGLAASGWHTACFVMRVNYDCWLNRTASMGAPGIDELKWLRPVRPGDQLTVRRRIEHKRVSKTRPDMGLVSMTCDVFNQSGEAVLMQKHTQLIELRHPQGDPQPQPPAEAKEPPRYAPPPAPTRPYTGFLEDIETGAYTRLGEAHFSRESIVGFAQLYDPQRFHLSEEEARNSHFGALAASGWQTASFWMRNYVLTRARQQAQAQASNAPFAQGGPSPGFTHLRWIKPVFVGDTIVYGAETLETRATSKPGWGLVFSRNTGVNQHGELVFEFRGCGFVPTRAKA
ncbi:MAG: MaoC family dehydratase N-terminal domain-containing protein [Hyphomicrobiales bacterium]|nr:MaoC family dehydratase N-terminal domain-containing protein [Hyphomicrobiales bacterium]